MARFLLLLILFFFSSFSRSRRVGGSLFENCETMLYAEENIFYLRERVGGEMIELDFESVLAMVLWYTRYCSFLSTSFCKFYRTRALLHRLLSSILLSLIFVVNFRNFG